MIILLFSIIFLIVGYSIALVFEDILDTINFRLGASILFSVALITIPLYFFNILSINFNSPAYIFIIFGLSAISLIFSSKGILRDTKIIINLIKTHSKKEKAISILLILSFYGGLMMNSISGLKQGDGMANWSWKAKRWAARGKIQFLKSEQRGQLFKIIASYPMYHSLAQTASILILPISDNKSVKILDYFYLIGIFFLIAYFVSSFGFNYLHTAILAILLTYSQRALFGLICAGYAEINIIYLVFLISLLLGINGKQKTIIWRTFFIIGLCCGSLATTKNEGVYRFIIFLGLYIIFYFNIIKDELIKIKNIISLTAPFVFFKVIDKINIPVNFHYNEYLDGLNLNFDRLISQAIIISKAGLFSLFNTDEINIKNMWIPTLFICFLGTIYYIKNHRPHEYKKLFFFLNTVFWSNFFFNLLPLLLAVPNGNPNTNWKSIGINLISRLNHQTGLFLTLGMFLFLIDYFEVKKIIEKST